MITPLVDAIIVDDLTACRLADPGSLAIGVATRTVPGVHIALEHWSVMSVAFTIAHGETDEDLLHVSAHYRGVLSFLLHSHGAADLFGLADLGMRMVAAVPQACSSAMRFSSASTFHKGLLRHMCKRELRFRAGRYILTKRDGTPIGSCENCRILVRHKKDR